jgi:molybdopterin-guanine dinucleotide biosynthesis protein A
MVTFDAVILAGGHSTRLGGADKALVSFDGITLLERAVAAAEEAQWAIAVGPQRNLALPVPVTWVQEYPPGRGPAAALAAGLAVGDSELVLALAVDHPLITREHVRELVRSVSGDGAVAVDDYARRQPLVAVYRRTALEAAMASLPDTQDASLRAVTARLALAQVELGHAATDCDTWEAIETAAMAARRM